MSDVIEAIAESIITHVRNDDPTSVDQVLKAADERTWREVLRYELSLVQLMDGLLHNDIIVPRLVMFDITTISAFHYAALRGCDVILERFLARSKLPVDVALETGTTALHLACFSGAKETSEMLIVKYRAGINRKDIYGWTPLHYATLGGQLDIVHLLVFQGADTSVRDKDGTSAAFRAEAFGRDDIVSFLLDYSGDDDQLLVDDDVDTIAGKSSDLYASVAFKTQQTKVVQMVQSESEYEVGINTEYSNNSSIVQNSKLRPNSLVSENPYLLDRNLNLLEDVKSFDGFVGTNKHSESVHSSVLMSDKSNHLSSENYNNENIYSRHLITESTLKAIESNSVSISKGNSVKTKVPNAVIRQDSNGSLKIPSNTILQEKLNAVDDTYSLEQASGAEDDLDDIGNDTLTKILREEFLKFRATKLKSQTRRSTSQATAKDVVNNPRRSTVTTVNDDYEEIGTCAQPTANTPTNADASFNHLKNQNKQVLSSDNCTDAQHKSSRAQISSTSVPPPLPPRNSVAANKKESDVAAGFDDRDRMILILSKIEHDSAIMEACFKVLSSRLHSVDDWKKLAYSLPLRDSSSLVEEKIQLIEDRYPGDVHRQSLELLRQWRSHRGEKATVGGLTLAMKNCGLCELVSAVETGSEEFNA